MQTAIPVFPVEIFNLIIDFCPADTKELTNILRSCCLVSKYFVPLCRAYLFREIEIGFDHDNLSLTRSRLVSVLERDPRVGLYVKSVRYVFNSKKESEITSGGAEDIVNLYLCFDDDRYYPPSLHTLLPNVRTLRVEHASQVNDNQTEECVKLYRGVLQDFSGPRHHITSLTIKRLQIETEDIFALPYLRRLSSKDCRWPDFDPGIESPPATSLSPPFPLEDLYLYKPWHFPAKLFKYCPNLARVEFSRGVYTNHSEPFPPTTLFTLSLPSVLQTVVVNRLKNLRELLSHIPSSTPLPSLSHLQIKLAHIEGLDDVEYILGILNRAPRLEKLELLSLPTHYDDRVTLPLDKCVKVCRASLKHFRLENCNFFENVWSDAIPLMSRTLSAIRGDNQLETIQLDIQVLPDDFEHWMKVTPPFWTTLDEILAVDSDFPHLETIEISVDHSFTVPFQDISQDEVERQNERMPEFWEGLFIQLRRMWDVTHTQDDARCYLEFERSL